MTIVLTIMSGKDPHTISGSLGWVWMLVGIWLVLWFRLIYYSGLCGTINVAF
jgi:hypothetical protein